MKFKYSEDEVTEMDTVKGVRESGKRLLTMYLIEGDFINAQKMGSFA